MSSLTEFDKLSVEIDKLLDRIIGQQQTHEKHFQMLKDHISNNNQLVLKFVDECYGKFKSSSSDLLHEAICVTVDHARWRRTHLHELEKVDWFLVPPASPLSPPPPPKEKVY